MNKATVKRNVSFVSGLSWGHVFSDVEISPAPVLRRTSDKLQWGHVFSDVEIALRGGKAGFHCRLQWGHVFSDVEIWSRGPLAGRFTTSFNGATSFQTWKCHPSILRRKTRRSASMGPRLFRRGNDSPTMRSVPRPRTLQWGHVFSDVEIRTR